MGHRFHRNLCPGILVFHHYHYRADVKETTVGTEVRDEGRAWVTRRSSDLGGKCDGDPLKN
jgi:hypothetical protein